MGGGGGLGRIALDYDGTFARNLDPATIRTADGAVYNGSGDEDADRRALHQRIAGTTSTASHTLTDRVLAWQAVAGADYALTDNATIGVKARWVRYGAFQGGNEWDRSAATAPTTGLERRP